MSKTLILQSDFLIALNICRSIKKEAGTPAAEATDPPKKKKKKEKKTEEEPKDEEVEVAVSEVRF